MVNLNRQMERLRVLPDEGPQNARTNGGRRAKDTRSTLDAPVMASMPSRNGPDLRCQCKLVHTQMPSSYGNLCQATLIRLANSDGQTSLGMTSF